MVAGKSNSEMYKPPRDPEDGPCGVLQVLDLTNKRRYTKEAETTAGEALLHTAKPRRFRTGSEASGQALRILDIYLPRC